jgi:hypothetical protein
MPANNRFAIISIIGLVQLWPIRFFVCMCHPGSINLLFVDAETAGLLHNDQGLISCRQRLSPLAKRWSVRFDGLSCQPHPLGHLILICYQCDHMSCCVRFHKPDQVGVGSVYRIVRYRARNLSHYLEGITRPTTVPVLVVTRA